MNAPYALALAAGLIAAFNPCGFALLPSYLALLLADGRPGVGPGVRRALAASASMTAGFVAVFGAFGLLVIPLELTIERYLPWVTVVLGIALVAVGFWLASGRELASPVRRRSGGAPGTTVRSMITYGVAYALASLSCTIGPFLAIMSTTFTRTGPLAGVVIFLCYALGMGLVTAVLAVSVALARDTVVGRLRHAVPYVSRASGVLLIFAGAYVTYYGTYELRVFGGSSTDDTVIDQALAVQGSVVRLVQALDVWWWVGLLIALAVVAAMISRRRAARAVRTASPDRPGTA